MSDLKSMQGIFAYPVIITIKNNTTTIDIPDFNIQLEEFDFELGAAIVLARKHMTNQLDEMFENDEEFPVPASIERKNSKGSICTFVDVNIDKVKQKHKSLEQLEEMDLGRTYFMWDVFDNCIEFLKRQKTMSVTFSQRKFANKIRKLEAKYPEEVKIIAQNKDGSIFAKLPTNYLHIYRPSSGPASAQTPEFKKIFRERITKRKKND